MNRTEHLVEVFTAACSSTGTTQAATPTPATKAAAATTRFAESVFDGTGGTVNLVFDDQGS